MAEKTLHTTRSEASGAIDVGNDKLILDVKRGVPLRRRNGKVEAAIEPEIDQILV